MWVSGLLVFTISVYFTCSCTNKTEESSYQCRKTLAKMNKSVLRVLCLVTLSNVQLGQSQCDGKV